MTMKKRIKMETYTRCLAKLEHHGDFDHEEEQDGMNVYKGLDVYVSPINDKELETKEKYEKIMEERHVLIRTLIDGVTKFEQDQTMFELCKQYKQINNDDDGAPTADANKQNESDNQKEEQNKEDIDKGTKEGSSEGPEESGSEGTEESVTEGTKESEGKEVQDDGKEENMNGDDIEVIVQMDVENHNEELNKEKDANETEDNDKMNNNEMKNDSVQEKQDADKDENTEKEKVETKKEKQDKADKVDNVQEKQGDHKDEISEDEF
ncbi:hypothetical protein Tco_1074302 [Tanacetum coccineum]